MIEVVLTVTAFVFLSADIILSIITKYYYEKHVKSTEELNKLLKVQNDHLKKIFRLLLDDKKI